MLPPDYRLLERLSRVAPLGIRFVDAVTGLAVKTPLEVVAYSPSNKRLPLFANTSNLYVLQNVPGLREFEFVEGTDVVVGDDDFWATWLVAHPPVIYTIEVNDPTGSYHPCQFTASVPYRHVFELDAALHGVPLYATVARPVPANLASVRADLYDPQNARPAAWAVLELLLNGSIIAHGIADREGRVSIALPYPIDLLPASPPLSDQPLSAQSWPLTIQVRYPLIVSPPQEPQTLKRIDLATVLNQPAAQVWDAWTIDPLMQTVYPGDTLLYGRPLVLRSSGLSVLYVTV